MLTPVIYYNSSHLYFALFFPSGNCQNCFLFKKKNKQYTEREREQLYPFSPLLGNVIEVTSIRVYIYIQWPKIFFPFF